MNAVGLSILNTRERKKRTTPMSKSSEGIRKSQTMGLMIMNQTGVKGMEK